MGTCNHCPNLSLRELNSHLHHAHPEQQAVERAPFGRGRQLEVARTPLCRTTQLKVRARRDQDGEWNKGGVISLNGGVRVGSFDRAKG